MSDPFLEAAKSSEKEKTDPFLAAAYGSPESAPVSTTEPPDVLQRLQSALGRVTVKEGGRLITGTATQFHKIAPYDVHLDESGKLSLRDITPELDQRRDQVISAIDKFADDYMHASDEDRQPRNLVERLAYDFAAMMPLAPVYEFLGGPTSRVVDQGLAHISRKFGPTIAKQVGERLPEALRHAGKYLGEVTAEGIRAAGQGFGAEIFAGSGIDKAVESGLAFGAFTMGFKGLVKGPLGALKRAAWDAKAPKTEKMVDPFEKSAGVKDPEMEPIARHETTAGKDVPRGTSPEKAEELHTFGSNLFKTEQAKSADKYLRENGYEVIGLQEHPRRGELFWFTDPKTGSTLLMPVDEMTPEGIAKHVELSRAKFFPKEGEKTELHSLGSIFRKPAKEWTPDEQIKVNDHLGETDPYETFYDYALSHLEKNSLAAENVFTYTRKAGQQLRDFLDLNGIPSLTRLGVADPAFEHGGAHLMAPRMVDDMIAKVMGGDYKDWRAKSMLTGMLVKDRILSGYDYNVKLRNDALLKAQEVESKIQYEQEGIWLEETRLDEKERGLTDKELEPLQKLYDKMNELKREKAIYDEKANNQHRIVTEIERNHDLKQYDWDIRNALRRDYISWKGEKGEEVARLEGVNEKIRLWNEIITTKLDELWKQAKNIEEDVELEETGTYGKYTGARISLVHKDAPSLSGATGKRLKEETESPSLDARISDKVEEALSSDARSQKRGTANVARDPKDRRALFAGKYTLSMEKNLNNTIRPRLEIATKENLYKALEEKNVVAFDAMPKEDSLPNGVSWVKWPEPVKRPKSEADPAAGGFHRTELVDRTMWVRSDAMTDLQGVLNVGINMKPMMAVQLATRIQLFQVVDFVSHAKNLISEEARSLGKGSKADVASRIPGISTVDAVRRIHSVFHEVRADSPSTRAEIAEIASLGALRPAHGQDAILPTGRWLWEMDTATRVLMNRQFNELVKAGKLTNSVANRRNFINQVGQYNDRFMGPWMRWARRVGFSPFIVAGRTFNRNSSRLLTGAVSGEATGPEAEADMRRLNLLTVAMSATIPMIINSWTVGNPLGRDGTPLFGIDLGREQKDDGTHDVIDLGQVSGLARATRNWGIADTYQGIRAGQTPEQIVDKASTTVLRGRSHPWTGPGPAVIKDSIKEGPKKAIQNLNPTIMNPLGTNKFGPIETALSPESGERTPASRVGTLLDTFLSSPAGAFGYKDVRHVRSAAEQYITENRTKYGDQSEEKMKQHKIREHSEALLKKDEAEGKKYLQEQIDKGAIDVDYAERIMREKNMSRLQRGFNAMSVTAKDADGEYTAIGAYKRAKIHEKAQIFRQLEQKVENQRNSLSEKKIAELDKFLDEAYKELEKALRAEKIQVGDIYEKP